VGEEYFLKESPTDILFTSSGKLITEVPLMLGVNKEEGAYRAIRKFLFVFNLHYYISNQLF
jgi:hypothetical protein